MRHLLFALVLANIASFLWSVVQVFKKHGELDQSKYRIFQALSLLTWVTAVTSFWRTPDPTPFATAGVVGQILTLTIFWSHTRIVQRNRFSLIFSNDVPAKIVQAGLYRWIRHPFYLCYLLCYYSLALALLDWPMLVCSVVMTVVYWNATLFEEKKFLSSHHAGEYEDYLARTGRFFPKIF